MSRSIGAPPPTPRCRSYTYMGSCRKPPPGSSFPTPRDSGRPIRAQQSNHVTKQAQHVTQSSKGGRDEAPARSHNKKKGSPEPPYRSFRDDQDHSALIDGMLAEEFFDADSGSDLRSPRDEEVQEKEKEKGEVKGGVDEDSGGDSSSWMTQYIAHNATLGNEKKGEPSCF